MKINAKRSKASFFFKSIFRIEGKGVRKGFTDKVTFEQIT